MVPLVESPVNEDVYAVIIGMLETVAEELGD